MELVPGRSLADHQQGGKPLPLQKALEVCRQIADGLAAAHEVDVIHRDLKPANVMLTPEGQVKVLDFGLARSTAPAVGAEESAITDGPVGTAPYMSPEQVRGDTPLDRSCDVWAFGCVLYEALTGNRVFRGATPAETVAAILEREPDWSALPAGLCPRVA